MKVDTLKELQLAYVVYIFDIFKYQNLPQFKDMENPENNNTDFSVTQKAINTIRGGILSTRTRKL